MNEDPQVKTKTRSWLSRLTHLITHEPQNKEELMTMLRDAEDRDLLSTETLDMIECVLQVSDMQVRDIMIPKSQMVAIEEDSPLSTIMQIVIESGHSRFPVFSSSGNDVKGILLAKDILKYPALRSEDAFDILQIMRPAIFIPQSKRLDILLKEFRINRNHMAMVIDEYGHVAGLVTIEDVLEQIVGEIEDEYDIDEDDYIKKHTDDTYTVKAATPIDDFNDYFSANFSDEEFDTIGGLVLKGFAHLPKRGEVLTIAPFRFKILHSDNRRIHLLEVRKEEEK